MLTAEATAIIHAIGYEGVSIERFLSRICEEKIEMVIDVRANPISRKPGFSKTPLRTRLRLNGIKYEHFPKLGIPSYVRKQYDDIYELLDYYDSKILTLPATYDLAREVADICYTYNSVILCFEKDPKLCHRSRLARYIANEFGLSTDFITYERQHEFVSIRYMKDLLPKEKQPTLFGF